ncbi:MAG: hypothetical protein RR537_00360 [Longicatena sp.]
MKKKQKILVYGSSILVLIVAIFFMYRALIKQHIFLFVIATFLLVLGIGRIILFINTLKNED